MMVNDVVFLVDYIIYIQPGWWEKPTPLKNMKVSWDYSSQHMEK